MILEQTPGLGIMDGMGGKGYEDHLADYPNRDDFGRHNAGR